MNEREKIIEILRKSAYRDANPYITLNDLPTRSLQTATVTWRSGSTGQRWRRERLENFLYRLGAVIAHFEVVVAYLILTHEMIIKTVMRRLYDKPSARLRRKGNE